MQSSVLAPSDSSVVREPLSGLLSQASEGQNIESLPWQFRLDQSTQSEEKQALEKSTELDSAQLKRWGSCSLSAQTASLSLPDMSR